MTATNDYSVRTLRNIADGRPHHWVGSAFVRAHRCQVCRRRTVAGARMALYRRFVCLCSDCYGAQASKRATAAGAVPCLRLVADPPELHPLRGTHHRNPNPDGTA